MPRIKLTLAYMGSRFQGWQSQPGGNTVQDILARALSRICDQPVRVRGAGRTDAGVHALGQVAHFDAPENRTGLDWRLAANALLPRAVNVVRAEEVNPEFHAQYHAVAKTYAYHLWLERGWCLPQRRPFVWTCGPLDVEAMKAAADSLIGRRDFRSFMNVGNPVNSTVRTLHSIDFATEPAALAEDMPDELVLRFTADGFLKQMVRNMVGLLVEAGRGKVSPEDVRSVCEAEDRSAGALCAPAHGLCLQRVHYGQD
jgi:tRNA pseudouridine38-40 synthase